MGKGGGRDGKMDYGGLRRLLKGEAKDKRKGVVRLAGDMTHKGHAKRLRVEMDVVERCHKRGDDPDAVRGELVSEDRLYRRAWNTKSKEEIEAAFRRSGVERPKAKIAVVKV